MEYLFKDYALKLEHLKKQFKTNIVVKMIAHNSKSYDIHFVIKYCLENNNIPQDVIKKGTKIYSMRINRFHFIDSLSFLPIALKYLPKSFGVTNMEKGDFPHLYNKPENWYKILDHLPQLKYYQSDLMKKDEREKFLQWYEENKANKFDF